MKFVPLGGAGEIGASCYLVKIDGKHILFDCGLRISVSGGEGNALLPELQRIGKLDAVCVSHAHLDHAGADFVLEGVDVLITETTYGNQNHPDSESEERRLAEIITDVVSHNGNVLIPTPALSKAQEILLLLLQMQKAKALPLIPIFVDGLVRTICDQYEKMIRPGLFFQEDSLSTIFRVDNEETRKYLLADSPCIIVTSSGQLVGGPSVSYAFEILPNLDNAIIFLSYLDKESPAGQAVALLAITAFLFVFILRVWYNYSRNSRLISD